MNRKDKKRIDVLQQRLHHLRQQLAGARKQMDDPEELRRLETEVQSAEQELERLKNKASDR